MPGRVIPHRLPSCPGRDSLFTLRRNADQGGSWWVYYQPTRADGRLWVGKGYRKTLAGQLGEETAAAVREALEHG